MQHQRSNLQLMESVLDVALKELSSQVPPSPTPLCVSFTYQPFWLSEPFCRPKSRGLINPSNERDKRGDSDCRPAWRVSVTTGQTFRIIRGYEPHGRHLNPGWRPLKRSDTGGTYRMREKKKKEREKKTRNPCGQLDLSRIVSPQRKPCSFVEGSVKREMKRGPCTE